MTRDTRFVVASVTKIFVAALVLELAEEGKLKLEDRLARWLPAFPRAREITIRQLLNHTSGVFDFFKNPAIGDALLADPTRAWSPTEVLKYVKSPYFKPGAGWQYSNTGYLLLGLVIEKATGRPVAAELKRRFFGPLGLTSLALQGRQVVEGELAHGYRLVRRSGRLILVDVGDGTSIRPFTSIATATWTAGGMVGTADDLTGWAQLLYGGKVLRAGSLEQMLTLTNTHRPRYAYGLGLQRVALVGEWAIGHGGRLDGFRGVMRHLPKRGITIAVLTNWDDANADAIAAALLRSVEPWYSPRSPTAGA